MRISIVLAGLAFLALVLLLGFLLIPQGPSIVVEDPWVRPSPNGAAGYMVITNNGGEADVLISVSIDFGGMVMLHQTIIEDNIMKMNQIHNLELPPFSTVELKPGGYHIMIQDPAQPIQEGETVKIHLNLEKSGTITIDAPISQEPPNNP